MAAVAGNVTCEAVTEPVTLGEGPFWDHEEQALYYVSIFDRTIHKYVPATDQHTKSKLDGMPTFIIPLREFRHSFLVGLDRKVVEVAWSGREGEATVEGVLAEVDKECSDNRFNDGKADPRGRLFAGTMGFEYEPGKFSKNKGSLYRFDPDGSVHKLVSNVSISNGLCWDETLRAFYYIDSFEYAVQRYDYDVDTGNISNPRQIFRFADHKLPGIPDGMTIDSAGFLWIANFDGKQVIQIDPRTHKLLQKIPIPALQVTSLTFGGPTLNELYVTTAAMDRGEKQLPPCGSVFKLTGIKATGRKDVYARKIHSVLPVKEN